MGIGTKAMHLVLNGLSIGVLFLNCILRCHCKLADPEEINTLYHVFVNYFHVN